MTPGHRLLIVILFSLIGSLLLAWPLMPITAQEPIVFATNTPRAQQMSAPILTPEPPLDRYALRLWLERDLLAVLLDQVQRLTPGDVEREQAIRLLQYELEWRFPGAPHNSVQREQLLQAMLAAPRASVDMRRVVRASIADWLNRLRPSFSSAASFEQAGFLIEITPANLDGVAPLDAMLHTRYPAAESAETIYEDYVLAQVDPAGSYHILNATPAFPAAPLGDIQSIRLERIGNVNEDGLDELAVSVQTGDVNQYMEIYGWRNGQIVSLVEPGQALAFGEIVNWPRNSTTITVSQYRVESPAWGCLGEVPVEWRWSNNFFRPTIDPDGYTFVGSIACLLYGAEPFFEMPPQEAINTIQSILSVSTGEEEAAAQRAAMIVAMLNYMGGRDGVALETVRELLANAEPGSWLEQQAQAFLAAAEQPDATPVQVCAALQAASEHGACDVDQLLTRLFVEQPLRRDQPIEAQLAEMGISVLDMLTISEVGRFNREAVHFNLAGDRWWQFAPLAPDVYTAEKIAPPPGYEPASTPPPEITPPPSAYTSLLAQGDVASTLNVLNNAVLANPDAPLSSAVRYLQALGYDLLADRAAARQAYLSLWVEDTESIWGQLAAVHLERR
jgi:hypothetical protein